MPEHPLYIVDVFAEAKYAGNQLAVVADAHDLSDEEMQKTALEMNFSETTFVTSGSPGKGYDVRIFLPTVETPFAGRPTLGTAWVIRNQIHPSSANEVVLNLGIGKVPVTFGPHPTGSDILWMRPPEPEFGATHPPEAVVSMLGVSTDDIDLRAPVEEVSVGIPFVFVPLKNLDALKRSRLALGERPAFMRDDRSLTAVFVFCPETEDSDNHFSARMFFESNGVREDPATGSANTCFAGYLLRHKYFPEDSIDIRVEQGYEIGRPSLLYLRASNQSGNLDISVGGRVLLTAKGRLV